MASSDSTPPPLPTALRWAGLLLALLTIAVYAPSLSAPFVFDDIPAITTNPAITPLWPPTADLWSNPAGGVTTTGRPLTAFTFALNHALHGFNPVGFRVFNLALHLANAALLFGIVRRTRPTSAPMVALIAAALWCLHPLATNVVTYTAQRAESLAATGLLLALYSWTRAAAATAPTSWRASAVAGLVAGMLAKETAVVGPLLLLLFDRTFFATTWRQLWRERGRWHLALAATWFVPVGLAIVSAGRGDTAGFASHVSPITYLLTQSLAILTYLKLAVWPVGLTFDYGTSVHGLDWQTGLATLALTLALLGALSHWLHAYRAVCFLGVAFFVLLAPSSSVVPVATQTIAEHRFYLPLFLVLLGIAHALHRLPRSALIRGTGALALTLAALTFARNQVYQTEESLWFDTVAKRPHNARAHLNLGIAMLQRGDAAGALTPLQEATTIDRNDPLAWFNLGVAAGQLERADVARAAYTQALAIDPALAEAANNLGNLHLQHGDLTQARYWLRQATAIKPAWATPWLNLAMCEAAREDFVAARTAAREAARLAPASAEAQFMLARTAFAVGDLVEARAALDHVLRVDPTHLAARQALVQLLADQGDFRGAIREAERLQQRDPADPEVRAILDWLRNQATPSP